MAIQYHPIKNPKMRNRSKRTSTRTLIDRVHNAHVRRLYK